MRFDLEPFRQVYAQWASKSLATLLASGGVALAMLVVVYGALIGTGDDVADAETAVDAVAVGRSVFTPVTPPAPAPALQPAGTTGYAAPRFEDDVSLTRAVQAELKRAGCYSGPVNGVWTASTRAAMGEFAARVNARLPIDRSDPVLLALLETHNKISCAADCSTGSEPSCKTRPVLPVERSEVAGVERRRPTSAELREETPPPETASIAAREPAPRNAGAEDLGFSSEERRAPNPIAAVQTATAEPEISVESAAVAPATVVPAPRAAKPERRSTKRKYRKQPSIARQVSRGFRQLQRDLNKLF